MSIRHVTTAPLQFALMGIGDNIRKQQGKRLRTARLAAGYRSARDAAIHNEWPESSYRAHETGTRTIGQDDAERYSRRFRSLGVSVDAKDILFGTDEEATATAAKKTTVPLVGYVGAGSETHLLSEAQGPFDEVDAPNNSTPDTVAVEIRGESLGELFDKWLVFYDDVRSPFHNELLNHLCVVGLTDGRVLIKKVVRGTRRGHYTLLSLDRPIYDVRIDWAAMVKAMEPRK